MGEIVGHAPQFYGLLLNNQNNNNGNDPTLNNVNNGNGTIVLQKRVAEAVYLRDESVLPSSYHPSNSAMASGRFTPLRKAQLDFFNVYGYLVLPSLITADETNALRDEVHDVIRNISEGADDKIISYKLNDDDHSSPRPSPIGNVVATFESTPTMGVATQIARLGCSIHTLLPGFSLLTHHPFHRSLYTDLMPSVEGASCTEPLITQSQVIIKSGDNKGSAIIPHQDSCVSFTDPPSCLTYWYALEDSTVKNGCLEVLPGSHIIQPLRQRVIKGDHGEPVFVDLEEVVWARRAGGKKTNGSGREVLQSRCIPLEVEKGSLVLFHGNLMHKSGRNKSRKGRMAYTFSVIDSKARSDRKGCMEPEDGDYEKL